MAAAQDIAAALERVQTVLERRSDVGLHDDAPATARWDGGTRGALQMALLPAYSPELNPVEYLRA